MTDIITHKQALEVALSRVTEELQTLGIHNPNNPDDWIATPVGTEVGEADPNVAADKVEDWDERRAVLSELETRFNNVRLALKKIDEGTYGTCEVGGELIPEERLMANPAARTCIEHAEDLKGK